MGDLKVLHRAAAMVSRIDFYTDLGSALAPIIPIGALVEATLSDVRALGLIARRRLTGYEIGLLHDIPKLQLDAPFSYLGAEFDLAWSTAEPGRALDFLCSRHAHALRVDEPKQLDVPAELLSADGSEIGLRLTDWVSNVLRTERARLKPLSPPPEERHINYGEILEAA